MIRRLWAWLTAAPSYPATDADRRTIDLVGLHLPLRAGVAITVTTFALLFDYSRTFVPDDILGVGRSPEAMWAIAVERAALYGLVPLAVVVVGFRDRTARYGLLHVEAARADAPGGLQVSRRWGRAVSRLRLWPLRRNPNVAPRHRGRAA